MRFINISILTLLLLLAVSCSTHKVIIEAPRGKQLALSSQESGCRYHDGKYTWYWLWGAVGESSTSDITENVKSPVRVEEKITPGSVFLGFFPSLLGFSVRRLEVYECN